MSKNTQKGINSDSSVKQDRFIAEADEAIEFYSSSGKRKTLWLIVLFFIVITV